MTIDFNNARRLSKADLDVDPEPANGNEAGELVGGTLALPTFEPRRSKFKVEWFNEIEPVAEPAVVKGLLPSRSTGHR